MKKTTALTLGTLIVVIVICAMMGAQSRPNRRTPVLTTDELGSREAVSPSAETATRPSPRKDADVSGAIKWHRDLRQAIEVARAEGKLVVVDLYTDWCGWCRKMDKTVYADPAIVALSRQEVFVKINAEDGGEGQQFARKMRVRGYPTTIILDGQGKVLSVAQGYIASSKDFGEFVEDARGRVK
jgi:thiol:disulfide interchange protein